MSIGAQMYDGKYVLQHVTSSQNFFAQLVTAMKCNEFQDHTTYGILAYTVSTRLFAFNSGDTE